uniref:ribosomal protein L19 n=1 Tax=Meteora sporadica TaxID=2913902 RepID=UPI003001D95A|nr:ribosomal protein L19 [Meteora sporadica]
MSLLVASQVERQRRSIFSFPYGPKGDTKLVANNPKSNISLLSQIHKYKAGDILYIIMNSPEITGKVVNYKQNNYIGICIKSCNKELSRSVTIRNVIHGNAVEISLPLWSSNIKGIFRIGKKNVTSSRLYYLRYKSNRFSRIKNKSFIQNINIYNNI